MKQSPTPSIRRQAAQWLVRLDHQADAETRQAFDAWLALDPQHGAAVARLRDHLAPLQRLPAQPASAALRRTALARSPGRRITSLAVVALIGSSALLGTVYLQRGFISPDLSTHSDERRSERLADGSRIELDGDSAVDLQLDSRQRRVRLLRGQILVDVAKDPDRPFYVTTAQGSVRALGTRFIVERLEDATIVTMLESATQIDSAGRSQVLNAGQRLRLDSSGPGPVQQVDSPALQNAWNDHQLLADDQPLPQVLERLARHRKGLLFFDKKALSRLHITAMLPGKDSDQALRLLARTLPIQIKQYTPWLTFVSLKPDTDQK